MLVPLRCPLCHQRLLDADESIVDSMKTGLTSKNTNVDFQIKCPKCGKIINIVKESA